MTRRIPQILALLFTFALPMVVVGAAQARKTVWDGVYTAAQAARGKATYTTYCTACHREDLSGGVEFDMQEAPALAREGFMEGRDLSSVLTFLRMNMPADNPGTLTVQQYLDVLAYVFQQNTFPAGATELKPDLEALKNIVIVSKPN